VKVIVKVGESGESLIRQSKIELEAKLSILRMDAVLTMEKKVRHNLLFGNGSNIEKERATELFQGCFYSLNSSAKSDYVLAENGQDHPVDLMHSDIQALLKFKTQNIKPNETRDEIYKRCFESLVNLAVSFEYRDKYFFTKLEEPDEDNAAWYFLTKLLNSSVSKIIITSLVDVGSIPASKENQTNRLNAVKARIESKFTRGQCQKLTISCHVDKTWKDQKYFPHNRDAAIKFNGPRKFFFTIGAGIDLFRKDPIQSKDSVFAPLVTSPDSEDLRVKSELVGNIDWEGEVDNSA
jgi:hypothetical protein